MCLKILPAKLLLKQIQVIWYSVIKNIIYLRWSYCAIVCYQSTCTWLKKYLMYLMSSKYSEYLNLYLYLQIWKKDLYLTQVLRKVLDPNPDYPTNLCSISDDDLNMCGTAISNISTWGNNYCSISFSSMNHILHFRWWNMHGTTMWNTPGVRMSCDQSHAADIRPVSLAIRRLVRA